MHFTINTNNNDDNNNTNNREKAKKKCVPKNFYIINKLNIYGTS